MFCYQCEQTSKGEGCTVAGVCGKSADTAALQDLLFAQTKVVAWYANEAQKLGRSERKIHTFIVDSLFATVTNVNFDNARFVTWLHEAQAIHKLAKNMYEEVCRAKGVTAGVCPAVELKALDYPATADAVELSKVGEETAITKRFSRLGKDAVGLQELITYGLKGSAAYADHARILGYEDPSVYAFFQEALATLCRDDVTLDELTGLALKVGEENIKVMALLDQANTTSYGHPVPTTVPVTPKKGKAILISGHDLKDLEELLKQTEGKGINIYTHSEMLPAHGYPGLKKYPHLVGNYGGAWQDQRTEFDSFPGPIVMTTNCIQKPKDTYMNRIFTLNLVGWPGAQHIANRDFSPVIEAALNAPGFTEDAPEKKIIVGFGHNAVLGVADKVIEAVKAGQIRHFFLIGGCDGAKPGRNYYTELAESVPKDCVILTVACGKYRFNKLEFGDIGGIPRLLDVGQCNDSFSAVKIAMALADAFKTDINGLPLSLVLSWFEQKAVTILLSLLHLGVKNIRIGPTLPAFITPPVLNVLVEKFNIMPITTAEQDLKAILG
jgi:hydroxylamine reductase